MKTFYGANGYMRTAALERVHDGITGNGVESTLIAESLETLLHTSDCAPRRAVRFQQGK
jgi:hypothetical protein